ncbi:MAG: hypothetical protein IKU59_06890 [Bacteroidales bacterium]|nr:hypothetical protein [Bacteroidales bacterium]
MTLPPLANELEYKALSVIRGDFGNGEERKEKLGVDYQVIQNEVNKMYKNDFYIKKYKIRNKIY